MSDKQAPVSMLEDGEQYELLGSEDRTSYVLRSKSDQFTAHLNGEDASRFRADYETVKQQFPTWKPDQVLAQLWDQGGYSWLAAQEAD